MTTQQEQIQLLSYIVKDLKRSISNFIRNSNKILDKAKSQYKQKKELKIYFSNYRKDKFLKECYFKYINNLIKYIDLFLVDLLDDFDILINELSNIILIHKTTINENKYHKSNALIHFSINGFILVNSSYFNELFDELNKIYNILIYL